MLRGERTKAVLVRGLELLVVVLFAALLWDNHRLRSEQRIIPTAGRAAAFSVGEMLHRVPVVDGNGVESQLDLTSGRTFVAVLNPSCDTCEQTLRDLRTSPVKAVVLGHSTAERLPALAGRYGFERRAFTISKSTPRPFQDRFTLVQLFVVDNGKVVRTCQSVDECD